MVFKQEKTAARSIPRAQRARLSAPTDGIGTPNPYDYYDYYSSSSSSSSGCGGGGGGGGGSSSSRSFVNWCF